MVQRKICKPFHQRRSAEDYLLMSETYTIQKILKIFSADVSRTALIKAEGSGLIPVAARAGGKSNPRRTWTISDLPAIGERYGFLKKLSAPTAVAVFTTKGGVLKTTLALNLARMAALHNQKVCIVGLDMQCDITSALGYQVDLDSAETLEAALEQLNSVYGLADFAKGTVSLDEIVIQSDIPTLFFIPETPDLVALERDISSRAMRDFWLREKVVEPLKKQFDLIILDCSPNWNLLISNALVACDVLVSPLECKINNYRNYRAFKAYLESFKRDTHCDFSEIFIPTKFASTRKLSSEIRSWYLANVAGAIRESVHAEEAIASHLSLPEHSPSSLVADEMREVLLEIWCRMKDHAKMIETTATKRGVANKVRRSASRTIEARE
jgi:chromosome partitioning protein